MDPLVLARAAGVETDGGTAGGCCCGRWLLLDASSARAAGLGPGA